MDIASLLLLQPNNQIRSQCLLMEPRDLARFTQTNKRIREVCGDILAVHKDRYEKEKAELLRFFISVEDDKILMFEKENVFGQFTITDAIYPPDNIEMVVRSSTDTSAFDYLLSKISNVKLYYQDYNIRKELFSDEIKLDILRLANKFGYTNVYLYDKSSHTYTKLKSLNEFSII